MNKILTLLTTACTCLAGLLQWRRKKHRAALSEAVHTGDSESVSKMHHDLLRCGCFLLLILTIGGCVRTERVVINQPMVPVRLIHDGIPGWWLSDALYEATLLKLDALQQ